MYLLLCFCSLFSSLSPIRFDPIRSNGLSGSFFLVLFWQILGPVFFPSDSFLFAMLVCFSFLFFLPPYNLYISRRYYDGCSFSFFHFFPFISFQYISVH
ncbi:hypothetical protein BZA05DRAFT_439160, partial [Tricharina praecox]|uniref:uncharacterized protein n=1 Tax=Tricharina praecox TaxID=43433 RepID=UPI00221FC32D